MPVELWSGTISLEHRLISEKHDLYLFGLILRNKMACALNEDVCPVAFLVDNTREIAVVVKPGGGWRSSEALDATKCCVLGEKSTSQRPVSTIQRSMGKFEHTCMTTGSSSDKRKGMSHRIGTTYLAIPCEK